MATTTKTEGEFDFAVFFARYRKEILYGAGGVAAAVAIGWFWSASRDLKETRAEQAYASAERSFYSGNLQLGEADLARVVQRYGNTTGGVRASMLLARALYQQGKPDSGVARLREALGRGASGPFRGSLHGLIAAGLENSGKFDDAATEFAAAASAAFTQLDRELYQADQARALASAGKKAEALKIWQSIAARDGSPLVTEARLRIGELSVAPAKGS